MHDIAIVGDLHLAPRVASRRDNYFEALLIKVREIASSCKHVIFLGDVFEHETIPLEYVHRIFNELHYLKTTNGNEFYSIMGNHDIYNELESTLPRTALGLCDLMGIIKVIPAEGDLTLYGKNGYKYHFLTSFVNPNKCKEQLANRKLEADDILLLHQYFNEYDGVTHEDLKNLGCTRIFFGHEHKPMEGGKQEFEEYTAYRCGSCGRSKADTYQLNRHIFYYVLEGDEVTLAVVKNVAEGKEVFTPDAYNQVNLKKEKFIRNISEVVEKYSNNVSVQNKFSIKAVLEELHTPDKSMQYISSIYGKLNEKFE